MFTIYIGQTGRTYTRGITTAITFNNLKNYNHNFSNNNVEDLHIVGSSKQFNILENFVIHKQFNCKQALVLNEKENLYYSQIKIISTRRRTPLLTGRSGTYKYLCFHTLKYNSSEDTLEEWNNCQHKRFNRF